MKIIAASLAISLGLASPASTAASAETPTSYAMPETESWDMTASTGRVYRIFVSRPDSEPPEGGFPVLYLLDGNAMFAAFAETRRVQGVGGRGLDRMIVVGIGHPGEQAYDPRRMEDFTAPIQTPALKALYAKYPSGGRDRFQAFLLDELRPAIEKRYPVNRARQTLYGHSLGGLFALHLLYAKPGAFRTIVAASPSNWWDDQAILTEEAAFRATIAKDSGRARATRLVLMAGELETDAAIAQDTAALALRLAPLSALGLRSEVMILDGETHISVPHRSVTATLRAALRWP